MSKRGAPLILLMNSQVSVSQTIYTSKFLPHQNMVVRLETPHATRRGVDDSRAYFARAASHLCKRFMKWTTDCPYLRNCTLSLKFECRSFKSILSHINF
jgi:hypothetical protein